MSAALAAATTLTTTTSTAKHAARALLSIQKQQKHQLRLLSSSSFRAALPSPFPASQPRRMQQPLCASAAENVNPAAGDKMAATEQQPLAKKQALAPPAADSEPPLRVRRLVPDATLPVRGSALAAGYDVSSAEDTEVPARGKALVSTGLVVAVPEGTYGRVAPRSGLAWKHHIDVGAGVIDADYRGELKVLLYNHSEVAFKVTKGDRVAQLVLERIATPPVVEDADLGATARGAGGFGSTGVAGAPPPPAAQ